MANTTITDIPRSGRSEKDYFGIEAYQKGLEKFIRGAQSPITIALQGEWGSGKTSLMNVLKDDLCGEDGNSGEFYPIWINTWEFSLMRNSEDALKEILYKMSIDVCGYSTNANKERLKSTLRLVANIGCSFIKSAANNVIEGAGDAVDELINSEKETNNIAELRNALQENIYKATENNNKKFIFFIDDLDRIDPPIAVQLLELLKNIFTLEKCIFILAIDYDVVIKGLKPKFGELNDKNEREFRSFFDKIIQVPFSMPVSQYNTKNYLIEKLIKIGIIDKNIDEKAQNNLDFVEKHTIGMNPRSMKRFLNTLSLIKCISDCNPIENNEENTCTSKNEIQLETLINVAVVGIQVAYPKIYQMLCYEPGFTLWDEKTAQNMGIPRLNEEILERIQNHEEFDETWEQVIYRLCLTDKHLENNAFRISNLFNFLRNQIKNTILENQNELNEEYLNEKIKEYIQDQLNKSSVTSFSHNDSSPLNYNMGELMKNVIIDIRKKIEPQFKNITFTLPRVRYNGGIKTPDGLPNLQIYQNHLNKSQIRFQFRILTSQIPAEKFSHKEYFPPLPYPKAYIQEDFRNIENFNFDAFKEFKEQQERLEKNNSNSYNLWGLREILKNGNIRFTLAFDIIFSELESFYTEQTKQIMADTTAVMFRLAFHLNK